MIKDSTKSVDFNFVNNRTISNDIYKFIFEKKKNKLSLIFDEWTYELIKNCTEKFQIFAGNLKIIKTCTWESFYNLMKNKIGVKNKA